MGGKVWSEAEEKYFWRTAMSFSPKRAGIDRSKPEMSWPQLATQMQAAMGGEARRQYTETMMFEHYFQNIESQRVSPNAVLYVYEYNIKKNKANTAKEAKSLPDTPHSIQSPNVTTEIQMETGLEEKGDNLPSSDIHNFGAGGPSCAGPLAVRRLPYAPGRDSQTTVHMPPSRFQQPPENTFAHPEASLGYGGDEGSDYDEGEISEYGGGETSESDEDKMTKQGASSRG